MYTREDSVNTLRDRVSRTFQSSKANQKVRSIIVSTRDLDDTFAVIEQEARECETQLYRFSLTDRQQYSAAQHRWEAIGGECQDFYSLFKHVQELKGGGVILLEGCMPSISDEGGDIRVQITLSRLHSMETIHPGGLVLVFLVPPDAVTKVPCFLADQVIHLELPLPQVRELEKIARETLALALKKANRPVDIELVKKWARQFALRFTGFPRTVSRNLLQDCLVSNPQEFETALQWLELRKEEELERTLAMNILDTTNAELPEGYEYLFEFLAVTKEKMHIGGKVRPKGILIFGPTGTGKTMLARGIGRIVGLPVVWFRISSLMNSLLGESERLFARAFSSLEAMAPNIVLIDEIEKAFGDSRETDGGTMMRCTGGFLSWLSDNRHPNYIIATANNIGRMGEIGLTMTRSERFDACFFADVPNCNSRRLILEKCLAGKMEDHPSVAKALAEITEKFSGADLQSVVKQAIARSEHGKTLLSLDCLKNEIERKRMRVLAVYDEFHELRRWGRMYADPAGPTDD